jgi:Flp pilus assembly protein TadG
MTLIQLVRVVRRRQDAGAVAVLVTILLAGGVLLGMAALTVDVGALYGERRQLQNSADAGALSLAQDCSVNASGCTTNGASIAGLVDDNDTSDGTTDIAGVCVHTAGVGNGACSNASAALTDCLPAPGVTDNYVEVRTSTRTSSGGTLLPPFFAQALVGGSSGTTVGACSRAAWGGPSSLRSALPLTISDCEFEKYVSNPPFAGAAPGPPYFAPYVEGSGVYPPASWEKTLLFHTTNSLPGCPASHSGSDTPISGGFGWLDSDQCSATSDLTGLFITDPGSSVATGCSVSAMQSMLGQVVDVPIYNGTNNLTGQNGGY